MDYDISTITSLIERYMTNVEYQDIRSYRYLCYIVSQLLDTTDEMVISLTLSQYCMLNHTISVMRLHSVFGNLVDYPNTIFGISKDPSTFKAKKVRSTANEKSQPQDSEVSNVRCVTKCASDDAIYLFIKLVSSKYRDLIYVFQYESIDKDEFIAQNRHLTLTQPTTQYQVIVENEYFYFDSDSFMVAVDIVQELLSDDTCGIRKVIIDKFTSVKRLCSIR